MIVIIVTNIITVVTTAMIVNVVISNTFSIQKGTSNNDGSNTNNSICSNHL